jgi:hypothetical protein
LIDSNGYSIAYRAINHSDPVSFHAGTPGKSVSFICATSIRVTGMDAKQTTPLPACEINLYEARKREFHNLSIGVVKQQASPVTPMEVLT